MSTAILEPVVCVDMAAESTKFVDDVATGGRSILNDFDVRMNCCGGGGGCG